MKIDHVPGYIKNNPPDDNTPVDPIINNTTTTTQTTNNNTVNNAYTVNVQYGDVYKAKYHHRFHHDESKIDYDKLFRSTFKDIVNLKFSYYRRDFLINFLNSMF